jgi:phosphatidylserine/phosphatidylglycerophosphate/cardiolipin synthase-like enzyme
MRPRRNRTPLPGVLPLAIVALAVGALPALPAAAQDTLPPHLGGYIRSLGLPARYNSYAGVALGLDRAGSTTAGGQLRVGVTRPVGSPVTHLLSVGAEAYGGVRDHAAAAGVRGVLVSHALGLGAGADFDGTSSRLDPFVTLISPVRRGGVAGRGSDLRVEWFPTRGGSVALALTTPLNPGHRGRTRPLSDHVTLAATPPRPLRYAPDPALQESLARIAEAAHWINRLSMPALAHTGRARPAAVAHMTAHTLAPLQQRLAARTVNDEVSDYHADIERAFSLVVGRAGDERGSDLAGGTELGREVAQRARSILLHGVIFPYNRLLGQRKRDDTTLEFAVHARGAFARWLISESEVAPERTEAALYVFQRLLDVVEQARVANRAAWNDSRLVWLPLQLALRPQDYVEQEALDSLVSSAVGRRIVHGNRLWYVYNERFQRQIVASISEAEEYHVLWVHDFRGLNEQRQPDRLSLLLVTQAYLAALTRRVTAYDSVGRLPAYMLFLDQHYFELNASRDLLALLRDPLHHTLRLPSHSAGLADTIAAWQTELRHAVASSRLLAAERDEYGAEWLRRLVRVHVSVTNPADPSFRSNQILRFVGMPDDFMRDHRKAVLYDVSEEDPYRGMAMYAGMGVGEHYASTAWEDRALMIQGPVALTLRDAARALLEVQGIRGGATPRVLRPLPRPPDYDERVQAEIDSMDVWGGVATRALELHNSTGFGPKEIAVAQATLFNLTSAGAVFKVPDSLWLNELLASLLCGAALRGTRVLPIAPSAASAPAPAWGLPGIHDVFSRMLSFSRHMAADIERAGGMLRPGLYHAESSVNDLPHRMTALAQNLQRHEFLRELYPTLLPALAADAAAAEAAAATPALLPAADAPVRPTPAAAPPAYAKLHFKGFLYVSAEAWARLLAGPPLIHGMRVYLDERGKQLATDQDADEKAMGEALQRIGVEVITPLIRDLPPEESSRWVFFLQVGSPNLDYRSMLLDGEVAMLVSNWTSLYGALDFLLLTGLVSWIETQAELDALLPPPSRVRGRIARWIRLGL